MVKLIKRLFKKHKLNYIGKYYSVDVNMDAVTSDFTLYKVWYCSCGKYIAKKVVETKDVSCLDFEEICVKYRCQGFHNISTLKNVKIVSGDVKCKW